MKERAIKAWKENWLFLLVIAGIVAVFAVLRTPASAVTSTDEVETILNGGQPVIVQFFSNT